MRLAATLGEVLPSVNAGLNSLSAVLLSTGYYAIRTRRHRVAPALA